MCVRVAGSPPPAFASRFRAKLVVLDACDVPDELLRVWQQIGYLTAETVVAHGGGQHAKDMVQPKQKLVVVRLLGELIDAKLTGRRASIPRRVAYARY